MAPGDDEIEGGAAALPSSVLTALRQAPLGIAIFDRRMRYLAASSQYLTDQGLPGDTPLVGRLHYDVFPEIPQKWRDLHAKVLSEGVELRHEADPFEREGAPTEWIAWSMAPWRTDAGAIGGLVLYTAVVTRSVEDRQRLQEAEARYRGVFDQAAVGVAIVSPAGAFLEVNDRFCEITRYSRQALLRLSFQEITHPEDLEAGLAEARRVLEGATDTCSSEKRYLSADGETVWVNLTGSLVRRAGEPYYFVLVIEDIGARKAAEALQQRYYEQLRLLINELNHRVKNTLATVQSIAAQTMRFEPDPALAYRAFEARLMGLAEVHEVLTRERWHGAALAEVAARALRPFLGADLSGRVRIDGPDVWLNPAGALTLALVFHELATNAVKYGALSSAGGRVELTWSTAAEGRLHLAWQEAGGPPVSAPKRHGFGSRLIERGLKGELRGSAHVIFDPAGVRCELEAQIPARSEESALSPDL